MNKTAKPKVKCQYFLLLHDDVIRIRENSINVSHFIQVLEVREGKNKSGKMVKEFNTYRVDQALIKHFPKKLKKDLEALNHNQFYSYANYFAGSGYNKKVPNIENYVIDHLVKQYKLLVDRLTEATDVQWYHKVVLDENKTRIERIRFVRNYASLDLELVHNDSDFGINYTLTTTEGEKIHSSDLLLSYGFLRKENIYYILKIKDMNVLYLIHSLNIEQHKNDLLAFTKYVLAPIEKTHKVKRKDLDDTQIEKIIPRLQLHLTELAGNFLVITPKFNYGVAVFESEYQEIQELFIDNTFHRIQRHKEVEQDFRVYLKSLHPRFQNQFMGSHNLSFEEAKKGNWFFKMYHQWLDRDIEITGMDMLKNFRYSTQEIQTTLTQKSKLGNLVTFRCEIRFGEEQIKLSDVRKVLIADGKGIYLKDNSIGILTDAWLEEYALIFKHGKITEDEITVPSWIGVTDENADDQAIVKFNITDAWWKRWKKWQNSEESIFEIPKAINANLRHYQKKGFEWMVLLNEINAGCCLADDMGLGKTLQTITYLSYLAEKNKKIRALVICPASLLYNWTNEIKKFAPHFKSHVYYGNNRNFEQFKNSDEDILICSYATARNDFSLLNTLVWDVMILDESHHIRTYTSKTSRAIREINAISKVNLSGTPLVNNTFDLFSQFEVILPGFFRSQEFFNMMYATPIDKMHSTSAIHNLNKLTKPFILRRTKQQVAQDLPEKIETVLYCEMKEDQWEAYETIKEEVGNSVFLDIQNRGLEKSRMNILTAIGKLRQICSHPALISGGVFDATSSIKLEMLIEEIERNIGSHKVLVFSQYLGMLDIISKELSAREIKHFRFDGSTASMKRMEMVDAFQNEDSQERIFLVSLKAGNTGITLTEADYVFLVDPWWNEAIQRQAIDRTHRIGQKKTVFAYKMICKNTVEERMLQLQERKQHIANELVVEDENIVKNLSLEDIEFLFG